MNEIGHSQTAPITNGAAPQGRHPLHRLSAREAFARRKSNPFGVWPLADEPDNRFAVLAAPHYRSTFKLQPGQKIFTIGSCFARHIEEELAARGFDIPTRAFAVDKSEWARDPGEILNNYVPGAVAPQIRWAFGLEKYDLATHAVEIAPGRYIDPYLAPASRPIPAAEILARRKNLDALYRELATSRVVIITLGYVEAWFDRANDRYVNSPPPLAVLRSAPDRFELHVLDYDSVRASLVELFDLLDRVCPADYRVILTVSPAPLHMTFTDDDIAVANTYSKSALRAAAGEICALRPNIDYFPSYESVMLSPRNVAFAEDQIHVSAAIVRFNVDRMVQQYVGTVSDAADEPADIVEAVRKKQAQGHYGAAFFALRTAWSKNRDDPRLTVALARMYHAARLTPIAERMLAAPGMAERDDPTAMELLGRIFNSSGRYAEAAQIAEKLAATGKMKLGSALLRAEAYYHLGKYEEGLAALTRLAAVNEGSALVVALWKARHLEKLQRFDEAELLHQQCNTEVENFKYLVAYAEFLEARGRSDEARRWLGKAIALRPYDPQALRLRAQIERGDAPSDARTTGMGAALQRMRRFVGLGGRPSEE